MKLLFTLLFLVLLQNLIYSQSVLKKGSYSISGGVSFSIHDNDYPDYNIETKYFIFKPSFNYHIIDVLSIGGNIHFDYSDEKIETDDSNQRSIERIISFGPKLRYYFSNKNFAPFVESSLHYSILLAEKGSGYRISFGTGITYFFTKSAAVEPHVSYIINKFTNPDYNIKKFLLGIGINYYINN